MVFDESASTLQKTDYYPFGLEIDRNSPIQTPAVRNGINRYNFLGKETQVATGYIDLQARFYDPLIGRFMQVDPETGGQDDFSPYHYSFNNPIRFSDPDGRFPGPGTPLMGNPKHYIVEGFRQYFQAAGALVDRFFASSSTATDTKISDVKASNGSETFRVTTSANVTNTTTVGTNLEGILSMNNQNAPQGPLIKSTINPTGFYRKRSSSILNILVLEIFPYSFCIVG
jgi:RHS repeat-associated protein